jgi:hypothetical protein
MIIRHEQCATQGLKITGNKRFVILISGVSSVANTPYVALGIHALVSGMVYQFFGADADDSQVRQGNQNATNRHAKPHKATTLPVGQQDARRRIGPLSVPRRSGRKQLTSPSESSLEKHQLRFGAQSLVSPAINFADDDLILRDTRTSIANLERTQIQARLRGCESILCIYEEIET